METLGIFIGTVLGAALKQCGPVLVDIGVAIYRKILQDTAEVGKPNAELQKDWTTGTGSNPATYGVWNAVPDPKAGDGRSPDAGH